MRISTFKIANYKSFQSEQTASFSSGFNIIVGQNNAGKTGFLEALTLSIIGNPHRSKLTLPTPTTPLNTVSTGEITFLSTGSEIKELLLNRGASALNLSMPRQDEDTKYTEHPEKLLEQIFGSGEISFTYQFRAQLGNQAAFVANNLPAHRLYKGRADEFLLFEVSEEKTISFKGKKINPTGGTLSQIVGSILRERIFRFLAQRSAPSRCSFGRNSVLSTDASNLAEVLSRLQSNQARFRDFNSYVHRIFPAVYEVAVTPSDLNNMLEIITRTDSPESLRDDLNIPLGDSGTGIGQILGVLYVAMTSRYPQTIVIDEPNSFLHPAASRKLIECLKDFPQHQYIIATHSPEIIRSAGPETLILLRWERPRSIIEELNPQRLDDLRRVLTSVGAKLSDVFGADQVLWVEGETEEQCFPIILGQDVSLAGINLVPMKRMGDFRGSGSKPKQAFDIYRNLTQGNALLPPPIAFVFDQETRPKEERDKLHTQSGGKIHFLERRMYENYLLHSQALYALIATLPSFSQGAVTEEIIAQWLKTNGGKKAFSNPASAAVDLNDAKWVARVDSAKLLQAMFEELSEGRYEYRKPEHSVFLTQWLVRNQPDLLSELKAALEHILALEHAG